MYGSKKGCQKEQLSYGRPQQAAVWKEREREREILKLMQQPTQQNKRIGEGELPFQGLHNIRIDSGAFTLL